MMARRVTLVLLLVLIVSIIPVRTEAFERIPYHTYTEDSNGERIPTQDAYVPADNIHRFEDDRGVVHTLNQPEDFYYLEKTGTFYVLDSGNDRILVTNRDFDVIDVISHDAFVKPTGIAVDDTHIFVADIEAERVFVFDHQGELIHTIGRPVSPLFGNENTLFRPAKVKVDGIGNLYVVSEGSYNGILFFNRRFEFQNYFGSNNVIVTLRLIFDNIFLSDRQRANRLVRNRPPSPDNVEISDYGFVYTVTKGLEGNVIKKFNYVGDNKYPTTMSDQPTYVSIASGPYENVFAITSEGVIDEFDHDGNLLFSFSGNGASDPRLGLIGEGASILVDSNNTIYVLDRRNMSIQLFEPTAFSSLVHGALSLYLDGRYVESRDAWDDVLKVNALFDLAHRGLGHAYFKENDYDRAFEEYRLAGYREGYSQVYWELRNDFLTENIPVLMSILFGFILLGIVYRPINRKYHVGDSVLKPVRRVTDKRFVSNVLFMFYFLRHPLDGFEEIKRRKRVSVGSTHVWVVYLVILIIMNIRFTGFLFNPYRIETVSVFNEVMLIVLALVVFTISNYLVSTLAEGEGRFSDIYIGIIHVLAPVLVFYPVIILLSNVLTLNESFLYYFPIALLGFWTLVNLFFMIKDIHYYQVKETFRNLFMTLFAAIILLIVTFILYNVFYQLYDFVQSIIREVVIRGER